MRKHLILLIILFTLVLSACVKIEINDEKAVDDVNKIRKETNSSETEKNKQDLKLQVLKGDKEQGVTIENNLLYSELDKVVEQNPNIGGEDDFSVYVVDIYNDDQGQSKLVLFGINRLPVAIKNIKFAYTMGNNDNEYVWERQPIEMNEETAGVLQPNGAIPIVLSITEEQVELIRSLEKGEIVTGIDGFIYDEVK